MKIFFSGFLLFFSLTAISAVTEKPCHPGGGRQIRLLKSRAAVKIDRLIFDVRENLARNDLTLNLRLKLHVAGNVLHCSRKKLGNLRFVCADSDISFSARTYPLISNIVYLKDNFFRNTNVRQRATLIHEAAHHCGAGDSQYFDLGRPPTDGDFVGWQVIADTYSYWAENGFCLPGDCR